MLRPPIGVALLGFLALVAGVSQFFLGLKLSGFVVFGPGDVLDGYLFWGILALVAGVALIAAAFALWATQPWGWAFANFVAVFGLLDAFFVLLATHDLVWGLAAAALPAVTLWYLNTPEIRKAFLAAAGDDAMM